MHLLSRYTRGFNWQAPGKEVYKMHSVVTVLNEKGNSEAEISLPYNKKFSAVSSFEMRIYDAAGNVIKKYHKGDMYEHAANEGEALVTDDRVKEISHTIANYPTTVEMIYEIDENSLINVGRWIVHGFSQQNGHLDHFDVALAHLRDEVEMVAFGIIYP